MNVTLFGNRVFADVIKVRSYWIKTGPKFNMNGALIRREDKDAHA